MPIYEYHCPKCGTFETTQRITEPALKRCPTCKSKVERMISATSFVLKGSGWYATDYARSGSAKATDGSSEKSDSKPSSETASNGRQRLLERGGVVGRLVGQGGLVGQKQWLVFLRKKRETQVLRLSSALRLFNRAGCTPATLQKRLLQKIGHLTHSLAGMRYAPLKSRSPLPRVSWYLWTTKRNLHLPRALQSVYGSRSF